MYFVVLEYITHYILNIPYITCTYSLASSPTQNPVLQHQKIHFGAKEQQKAPPERRTGTQIHTG